MPTHPKPLASLPTIEAVLFDKDGTLYDFHKSWSGWTSALISDLSEGDARRAGAMAASMGFDLGAGRFLADSPVIAGTLDDVADCIAPHLRVHDPAGLRRRLIASAETAQMVEAVPLAAFLGGLRAQGYVLGVATNDAEDAARAHLKRSGIIEMFAHILGYDTGFTPKPAPDMLLGFADWAGVASARVAMVGDSTHDLIAGRAAGMVTIAVLTGIAKAQELAPYADLVLPDIGHLAALLPARTQGSTAYPARSSPGRH